MFDSTFIKLILGGIKNVFVLTFEKSDYKTKIFYITEKTKNIFF